MKAGGEYLRTPEQTLQGSLQSAFGSLDAASSGSSNGDDLLDSLSVGRDTVMTLRGDRKHRIPVIAPFSAKPRREQLDNQSRARPLAGGPDRAVMRREARARLERKEREHAKQVKTVEVQSMPAVESSPVQQVSSLQPLDPPFDAVNTARITPPARKRTMAWAAKRDRRNARRRLSPPLTRRRAALKGLEQDCTDVSAPPSSDVRCEDRREALVIIRSGEQSELTDPSSNGTARSLPHGELQAPRNGRIRSASKPALELTLSDAFVPVQPTVFSIATQPSSQTQSESDLELSEMITTNRNVRVEFAAEQESETEEEDDSVAFAPLVRRPATMPSNATRLRRPAAKPPRPKRAQKQGPKGLNGAADEVHGRPLFHQMAFVVLGFWSKARMYERLITKHAGKIVKLDDLPTSLQAVTHVVCCPHGTFRPDSVAVRRAMTQWCIPAEESSIVLTGLQQRCASGQSKLLDARWVSDCIEVGRNARSTDLRADRNPVFMQKCLTQDLLLPVEDYKLDM